MITDILGKTMTAPISGTFKDIENIDVRELNPGMYYLMIQSQNESVSLPFMVE